MTTGILVWSLVATIQFQSHLTTYNAFELAKANWIAYHPFGIT